MIRRLQLRQLGLDELMSKSGWQLNYSANRPDRSRITDDHGHQVEGFVKRIKREVVTKFCANAYRRKPHVCS